MLGTSLMLALREIRRHLMRSFLTTLGIIIGVSAVITMVTMGKGVTADIEEQISSLGSNVFFVFPIRTDRGGQRPFDQDDIDAIGNQIAGVNAVAGTTSQDVSAIYNGQDWDTTVEGADNAYMLARGIDVELGRSFSQREEQSGANVCIIGPDLRDELFEVGESPLGEQMRLDTVSCQIIGVYASRGDVGGGNQNSDNAALMPLKTVQRRLVGTDDIYNIVISYNAEYDSSAMQKQLVSLLRERRLLLAGQENDFDIIDTASINETVSSTVGTLTIMVAGIAAISLVVGGVGIMNIMLVSVTERTREIGIRLAIGALAHEVRMQFLTEAVVLCCFGGLVGIILGLVLSASLAYALGIPFIFDPTINIMSFLISALIGIVFGYFPARRAAALDPIEALRHE